MNLSQQVNQTLAALSEKQISIEQAHSNIAQLFTYVQDVAMMRASLAGQVANGMLSAGSAPHDVPTRATKMADTLVACMNRKQPFEVVQEDKPEAKRNTERKGGNNVEPLKKGK